MTEAEKLASNINGVIRDWNDGALGDVDALIAIEELLFNAGYDVGHVENERDFDAEGED